MTITDVAGSREPIYAIGSKLREIVPFVWLAATHTVGIAIFSYDWGVTFGISADSDETPDLEVLGQRHRARGWRDRTSPCR